MAQITKFFLACVFTLSLTATASAQIIVQGSGAARDCYVSTKTGTSRASAIRTCKTALSEFLYTSDLAATHVNLGILLMRKGDYAEAQTHYAKAIEMRPNLAEAHINHAASLIYMADYSAAVTSIDKAIEIGTEKMPEALYNRAVAYDRLQNYNGAYKDLKQVLILRPHWEPALELISGYQVIKRSKS